jgi:hypothetical protein
MSNKRTEQLLLVPFPTTRKCAEEETALLFCKTAKIKLRVLVPGGTKDTIEHEYCLS